MREWHDDPEYIVRLAKTMVSSEIISKLRSTEIDPPRLLADLTPLLQPKLGKMSLETLGKIIGYAMPSHFHSPLSGGVGFIRMAGLSDVCPAGFTSTKFGRELLEEIALATVTSVVHDIINQEGYDAQRRDETASDEEYDRAMEDYIHGRSRQ